MMLGQCDGCGLHATLQWHLLADWLCASCTDRGNASVLAGAPEPAAAPEHEGDTSTWD